MQTAKNLNEKENNVTENKADTSAATDAPIEHDELFLVDGSGFIFRAYYAMPQNLTNPDGVPVGAVMGFINIMLKLLQDMHAPYIAVIFDAARENFRNEIYADYKANRDDTPEDLKPQFAIIKDATRAFDIPAIEMEGFEADDLIATYARLASEKGQKVTIVSSDKDLMQLVDDNIRMFDPMKNKYIDREGVIEKFGVPPEKVIDVQSLAGDSVDNVPGVPGIGIKTAAQLINEYGSLEELLERAGEIKQPKRREKLTEHAEDARISKKLVTLDQNVDVPVSIEDLKAREPDSPELVAFLQDQGFRTILSRLKARGVATGDINTSRSKPNNTTSSGRQNTSNDDENHANIDDPALKLPPITENKYTLIQDKDTLQQWVDAAYEKGVLCIDTETTALTPRKAKLVGISICHTPGSAAYIPLAHEKERVDLFSDDSEGEIVQIKMNDAIKILKPLLEDQSVLKIAHNAKYDWQILYAQGIEMSPVDDTMLISYVLDGSSHSHGMDNLCDMLFGHETIKYTDVAGKGKSQVTFNHVPLDKALDYAAEDADITMRLHHVLKPRLAQEKMVSVYEDIERPLIPVIAKMEWEGIKVDPLVLKKMSEDFTIALDALVNDIHGMAGYEFNVASPKQVGEVLFESMGIEGGKKTKTGDWSTAANILDELALKGHKIVEKILEWRQLSKLKSTYTDALQNEIASDTGRVHTSYHMTGTSTGRLSSSDPNLQNIPIRTEEGRKIREAFIAKPGHTLLSVDYSQVELRLAAELAGVEALREAFRNNIDIHTLTASRVFNVPIDEVTPDIRRQAKAVNFGIIYGISGWGLAKQLGCDPGAANEFIRKYLAQFNEIQNYMEDKKDEARKNGFVVTHHGRKCFIRDINAKMHTLKMGAERQAINAPLQGTAADIMKIAMARIGPALAKENLSAKMLLQVHDELIFEVPIEEIGQTTELVKQIMENIVDLGVPLITEAGTGDNWAQAH